MDCETFEVLGRWEIDRGPQTLHYDFWWNLPRDYMVSSEWALPPQFENGLICRRICSQTNMAIEFHFWDLRGLDEMFRRSISAPTIKLRWKACPAHDPVREYGFLGVVVDTTTSRVRSGPGGAREASLHREDGDDSARARDEGPVAAAASRFWRRAAAGDPHRPVHDDNFSTSLAGEPARCVNTTSPTPESFEAFGGR